LGGRASEEIVFGKISTGALNDLEKITKQAYAMIVYFGLNKKIGNISYYDSTGANEYAFNKPYSETTAKTIDEELSSLVENAYLRAKQILTENRDKLEKLATRLLEKEVIFREDLEEIFGKRPYDVEEPVIKKEKEEELKTNTDRPADVVASEGSIVASIPKDENPKT
jgi:cell division protease FtsH